ncbi:protein XRP2-like [Daktulosphaira vitifoliae]|uniref:protein XRP2-like n=1 Tax=Daktulosphaira vitifoliae TaxID=58002 RepID=UPI0021A99562|nr:protein XRP2-like [Daktulosphaira vitifoliae]
MGCFFCKTKTFKEPNKKMYSWTERKHLNPTDYIIENLSGGTVCKPPGSIGGQQFVIRNCEDTNVFLLDHSDSIIVDDCQGCTLILGPTKQSVFIRDTSNINVIVACGQFRVRDCSSLKVSLFCSTQPIIESSHEMNFSCYQLFYNQLDDHFKRANLNIWNNYWRMIFDYTWNEGNNWTVSDIPISVKFPEELICKYGITCESYRSTVPLTRCEVTSGENCFIAFDHSNEALRFVQALKSHETNLELIKCKYWNGNDAKEFQKQNNLFNNRIKDVFIGVHIQGKYATSKCSAILQNDFPQFSSYISKSEQETERIINNFFVLADNEF